MGPVLPVEPVLPVCPVTPVAPVLPVAPVDPVCPVGPVLPVDPVVPVTPVDPVLPVDPVAPVLPFVPVGPVTPVAPVIPAPVGPVPSGPVGPVAPVLDADPAGPVGPVPTGPVGPAGPVAPSSPIWVRGENLNILFVETREIVGNNLASENKDDRAGFAPRSWCFGVCPGRHTCVFGTHEKPTRDISQPVVAVGGQRSSDERDIPCGTFEHGSLFRSPCYAVDLVGSQ